MGSANYEAVTTGNEVPDSNELASSQLQAGTELLTALTPQLRALYFSDVASPEDVRLFRDSLNGLLRAAKEIGDEIRIMSE